ncbi:hypothetical protein BDM02DRAFT_3189884 [Thelephora ganbajun]|uniref:Uncharacterized protein n=1 Tax=Thelephora ganbajun TaxID=370292 RepID=A0ACB6Z692_THEGA|nr:hypothetical protein BDM02DRAFT_3189884 [Thelephora ganbajun]
MSHLERTSNSPQNSSRMREQVGGGTVQQYPTARTETVAFRIDGCSKVYWIKKNLILSEPGTLCEIFATLSVEGEGTSEEQAIKLNSVIPEDFEALVHFYNDFETRGIPVGVPPFQYWDRLKRASRCYRITSVEERAYGELFNILIEQNPVMAVVIAEQNPGADQEWLYAAYRKLCLRARPLSDNEAAKLHGVTVNRIIRARQKIRHWNSLSIARRGMISRGSIIREVFRIQGRAPTEHKSR